MIKYNKIIICNYYGGGASEEKDRHSDSGMQGKSI